MRQSFSREFAKCLFERHYDAKISPPYLHWHSINAPTGGPLAVLGYRAAGDGPLFLECYLDKPVEDLVSTWLGTACERNRIVEIGCLAAVSSTALVRLWRETADLLGERYTVAVATLTSRLRENFTRVGLPFTCLAPAREERLSRSVEDWGSYYREEPLVCAGLIAEGVDALSRYTDRTGALP